MRGSFAPFDARLLYQVGDKFGKITENILHKSPQINKVLFVTFRVNSWLNLFLSVFI
jgi:hypothetical protein